MTRSLRHRTIQVMPYAAMALVVMLLGVLLWLLHRNEIEDEQLALIKDILWVEQNLNFHLTSDEEKLTRLAAQLGGEEVPLETFQVQAAHLVATNPEFERIMLTDAHDAIVLAVPPLNDGTAAGAPGPGLSAFTLSRSIGRVVYSQPQLAPGRGWVVEAYAPMFRNQEFIGAVVGVYSLEGLLTHHVPWWVAEKYKVELVDGTGAVLAAKSRLPLARPGPSHQVRLEPPGGGLAIVATLYRSEGHLARNLLAAAIVFLALSALWSLWALRRHMRRRLQAEQALRAEHSFRKAMEESLTAGMRARDLDGRVTYVNSAFCRMVGWDASELIGHGPPMPYWVPELFEETMEMHRRVMRGDAPQDGFEIQFRRRNGERFWALVYEAPLIDADGRHTGWMASVLDVTERKQAEELARQQQESLQRTARLVSMGEMASTLAHELNQPLSAIASYNTGCLNKLRSGHYQDGELEAALTKLGVQAQRAGQIIRRVHDFVRKSEPKMQACAINKVVADSKGLMDADARKRGVEIQLSLDDAEPLVMGDAIMLEQVLVNLLRNGIEAMGTTAPGLRRLTVSVVASAAEVVVSVADRGAGIPHEMAANLFQPFFSTKEEGMGMGLNICRSIMEYHHGRVWFEPAPDGGSIFRFSLPRCA